MSDVLMKQMKAEEALASREVSDLITEALNSKETIAIADDLHQTSGGWPYDPTRQMLRVYEKVADAKWRKIKKGYESFTPEIRIEATRGKPPSASAKLAFAGDWKGGESVPLRKGDTLAALCREVYGHDSYAPDVLLANEKAFGCKCTKLSALPAGFALEFPQIWVPAWKTSPKVKLPAVAKKSVVEVVLPTIEAPLEGSVKGAAVFPAGPVIITVDLESKGTLKATKKGKLDATFNLATYETSAKKAAGPITTGFKASLSGKTATSASITVFSAKCRTLSFSGKFDVKEGALVVDFGTKPFSVKEKDWSLEGSLTLTAKLRVAPNPRYKPKRAPSKSRAPARSKSRGIEVPWKEIGVVVVVVGGTAVVVAGGWTILAGGAAVKGGATALGGLALAIGLSS